MYNDEGDTNRKYNKEGSDIIIRDGP